MGAIYDTFAESDLLGALGASVIGRIETVERENLMLKRMLAYRIRQFRGIRVGDNGVIVTPDAEGFILFHGDEAAAEPGGIAQYIEGVPKPHGIYWYNGSAA